MHYTFIIMHYTDARGVLFGGYHLQAVGKLISVGSRLVSHGLCGWCCWCISRDTQKLAGSLVPDTAVDFLLWFAEISIVGTCGLVGDCNRHHFVGRDVVAGCM